jgi:hypothetical protein
MSKGKVIRLDRRRDLDRLAELFRQKPAMLDRLDEIAQETESMGRSKKEPGKALTGKPLNLRTSDDDTARLDAMVDRVPILTKHAIALACMRIGLTAVEQDPTLLVTTAMSAASDAKTARPKGKGRK